MRSVLETKEEPRAQNSGFGLARIHDVLDLGRNVLLERIVGFAGDEQRMLVTLREQPGVLLTSLNYVGQSSVSTASSVLEGSAEIETYRFDHVEGKVRQTDETAFSSNTPKVLVVDPSPTHCMEVMYAVACGIDTLGAKGSATVVGVCLRNNRARYVDFFAMLTILARAVSLSRRIHAINLSVDFGILCLGKERTGGDNPLPAQLATAAYSFPIFEHVVQLVLSTYRAKQPPSSDGERAQTPAIFAPAGNREGDPRWRMAYPAVRPEVVAVTLVTQNKADATRPLSPHESADIPATSGVRLCMALDAQQVRESGSPVNGTSFACAWLAGAYTALSLSDPDLAAAPPIGKQAYLFQRAGPRTLEATRHSWITPRVHLFAGRGNAPLTSRLQTPLRELNEQYPEVEFMLTGSAALVDAWLNAHGLPYRDVFKKWATPSARDFDVTFFGSMSAARVHDVVKAKFEAVFASEFLMPGHTKRVAPSFDVWPIEDRVTGTAVMQCVIPACDVHLTGWGWLDAWGGIDEVKGGRLSISIPQQLEAWNLNPQFVGGSNGAALGILIWVNAILLLNAIATEAGLPELAPRPEPASLQSVLDLLNQAAHRNHADGREAFTLLFGCRPWSDGRVASRAERATYLSRWAGSGTNADVRSLAMVVDSLEKLRQTSTAASARAD